MSEQTSRIHRPPGIFRATPDNAVGINDGIPLHEHTMEDVLVTHISASKGESRRPVQPFDNRHFPTELYEGFNYLYEDASVRTLTAKTSRVQMAVAAMGYEVMMSSPDIQRHIGEASSMRHEFSQKSTRAFREESAYPWIMNEFYKGRRRFSLCMTETTADSLESIHRNLFIPRGQFMALTVIAAFSRSDRILPQRNGLREWCQVEWNEFQEWLMRRLAYRMQEINYFHA